MGACCHKTIYFQRNHNQNRINNQVQTTKYTWWNFLPKAVIIQFVRPANFVYLLSAVLQSIDVISSLTPVTAIAPFVFVIAISLIREGFQDYRRHKTDKQINHRVTHRLINDGFFDLSWQQLHVGDIVQIKNGETIPADILVLYTPQENMLCYVQTANLDGQTNLKAKYAHTQSFKLSPEQFESIEGSLIIDAPNSDLHHFSGVIQVKDQPEHHIDFDNIILRETVLKNSEQAIGVVIYTGYDTKIIQNQGKVENKISNVEKRVNVIQFILLIVLFLLATSCTIGYKIYHTELSNRNSLFYLVSKVPEAQTQTLLIFFSSFLLLTFLIPISLNVSIQVIKAFLGIFLNFDNKMYYEPINKRCNVNNVSILEELGKIDYVLTDKTGTLTANQMVFKHLAVGNKIYNATYLTSNSETLSKEEEYHKFWIGLLICHDVVCDPETQQYQGSSPDQVCFIDFARGIGYEFVKRTKNSIELNIKGEKTVYQLLDMIAFSARKRMTVVVKNLNTMKIESYTKGADSAIFMNSLPYCYQESIVDAINSFAKEGYRTLVFSSKEITIHQYEEFKSEKIKLKAHKLKKTLSKEEIEALQNEWIQKIQSNLLILGATAIQDRLQEKVPETIARLQEAGIIVMMITGDKLETAQNIGYLANFIKTDAIVIRIEGKLSNEQILKTLEDIHQKKDKNPKQQLSLIIEGPAINKILTLKEVEEVQFALKSVSSVIFCRSSPKQKARIVEFVKSTLKGIVLGIGDGGNDVGMIQVANVGVGILGKQGNSASVVSDFSIGQFRYLDRLILHHGRWFYYRLSYFFVYYGWKNLIMTLLLYFFMIDSAFSALAALSDSFIGVYNIIIGLCLVVYYSIFEQDINDDTVQEAYDFLPTLYKETHRRELFSYSRYALWTFTGILTAIFIFCSIQFSLGGNNSVGSEGQTGDIGHQEWAMAIILTTIVIMTLMMDIKMYTWFSTVFVIILLTIIGCLAFLLIQNYVNIGVNRYTFYILERTTLRFWAVVILNIGVVYFVKTVYDTFYDEKYPSTVEKLLIQNKEKQSEHYIHVEANSTNHTH